MKNVEIDGKIYYIVNEDEAKIVIDYYEKERRINNSTDMINELFNATKVIYKLRDGFNTLEFNVDRKNYDSEPVRNKLRELSGYMDNLRDRFEQIYFIAGAAESPKEG